MSEQSGMEFIPENVDQLIENLSADGFLSTMQEKTVYENSCESDVPPFKNGHPPEINVMFSELLKNKGLSKKQKELLAKFNKGYS